MRDNSKYVIKLNVAKKKNLTTEMSWLVGRSFDLCLREEGENSLGIPKKETG